MNRHLTSKMTAHTPSHHPVLPELWHTHITAFLSSLLTRTGKFATVLLSHAFCITHAHTYTHTQELHFERRQWVGRRAGKGKTQLEKCKLCHSDLWWWQVWERCGTTAGRSSVPAWLPCSVLAIFRWRATGVCCFNMWEEFWSLANWGDTLDFTTRCVFLANMKELFWMRRTQFGYDTRKQEKRCLFWTGLFVLNC